jgi:hypothetical protein
MTVETFRFDREVTKITVWLELSETTHAELAEHCKCSVKLVEKAAGGTGISTEYAMRISFASDGWLTLEDLRRPNGGKTERQSEWTVRRPKKTLADIPMTMHQRQRRTSVEAPAS